MPTGWVWFLLNGNFWVSILCTCNSLFIWGKVVKISVTRIMLPSLGHKPVSKLFSAMESTKSIWAGSSFLVKFCWLMAAIIFVWYVWCLAENVNLRMKKLLYLLSCCKLYYKNRWTYLRITRFHHIPKYSRIFRKTVRLKHLLGLVSGNLWNVVKGRNNSNVKRYSVNRYCTINKFK